MIISFTHPSPNSVPPTFHVSDLRFVSCFWSYSHFPLRSNFDPRARTPTLTYAQFSLPCYVLLVLIRSDPHVCSSVWNRHWLSLELTIRTSEPSPVSCLKFEDSRRLVAQHISWSRVLAENIEPRYTLSPSQLITDMFSSILIRSELHVCSSIWNWHRLSLLNSSPSNPNHPNHLDLCPSKLRTREHWVAKHQSLSHVLLKFGDDPNTVWFVVVFCFFCVHFCSVLCKQKRSYSLGRWLSAP